MKKKQKLWCLYSSTGFPSYLARFKVQQKVVQQLVLSAKHSYEKNIVSNIKLDPRAFFSYVRGKQKVEDSIGPLVDPTDGATVSAW